MRLFILAVLSASGLFADCSFTGTYRFSNPTTTTGQGIGTVFNNTTTGCSTWILTWSGTVSSMTIQLEYSANNADWSTFPASSVINGNNPSSGNNGKVTISSSQSYLRVNVVSALGPGTVGYSVSGTGGSLPAVLISTSGPVSDPGGLYVFQFNNAAGALTFNAPAGVAGNQRCYRNATGKSGAITIQMPASNTIDLGGTNSSSAGTLVSAGSVGDSVCIASDAPNHWYAYVSSGIWSTT